MEILSGIIPTETKIQLETNQIKPQYFNRFSQYIPSILEEVEEKVRICWTDTGEGFVWFERLVKKKVPNVLIFKNKASKTSIFANGHRKNK